MTDPIAGALAGKTQGGAEEGSYAAPSPPMNSSALLAWGMGMTMGASIANGIKEKNPDYMAALEASGITEEDYTHMMQDLMTQLTKSLGKSNERLKELYDDD